MELTRAISQWLLGNTWDKYFIKSGKSCFRWYCYSNYSLIFHYFLEGIWNWYTQLWVCIEMGGHIKMGKGSGIDNPSLTVKVDTIIFNCSEKPHFSLAMFREGDCTCAFVLIWLTTHFEILLKQEREEEKLTAYQGIRSE